MLTYVREPEGYSPLALETYRRLGEVVLRETGKPDDERALAEAEAMVIRLDPIRKDILDRMPKLRLIAVPTTGLNHIDTAETERRGIRIVSLKGRRDITEKIYATSELTVGLMLALLRRIPWAHGHVAADEGWDRMRFVGREISRKTVGILGCGRLGSRVATILQAMGATVIATEPNQPPDKIPAGVEVVPLDELLRRSDILSIHVDLNPQTTKFFGAAEIAKMKPGAYLVNTSRGEVMDEAPVLAALESGHLAGAALDVMDAEHPSGSHLKGNGLVAFAKKSDRLILVPHIGGATLESMHLTEEAIADEAVAALSS
jgi:D-3-phosphoglycerate dehydrogenase